MTAARPFPSPRRDLCDAAAYLAWTGREDWLEAFAAHPRIGERTSDRRAAAEQSGKFGIARQRSTNCSDLNSEYEAKFGYMYYGLRDRQVRGPDA